jgi:hypothetical protein
LKLTNDVLMKFSSRIIITIKIEPKISELSWVNYMSNVSVLENIYLVILKVSTSW